MMLPKSLIHYLSVLSDVKIHSYQPIGGGNISRSFLLKSKNEQLFLKLNSVELLPMFKAEEEGLTAIGETQTIACPKVICCDSYQEYSFLLLEYIEHKSANRKDEQRLGEELAEMHLKEEPKYGWERDNYIGSLKQENVPSDNWVRFYLEKRIFPQLNLAREKGLYPEIKEPLKEKMVRVCEELLGQPKASLVHGDLWGGNYLIASDGTPYLIDPAVYWGSYEVDIAMTGLFGGFRSAFYEAYEVVNPPEKGQRTRLEIYELYYYLVHLNLFGSSYYESVNRIINRYFA